MKPKNEYPEQKNPKKNIKKPIKLQKFPIEKQKRHFLYFSLHCISRILLIKQPFQNFRRNKNNLKIKTLESQDLHHLTSKNKSKQIKIFNKYPTN